MKPVDLARKLRRDAAFEPAALDRGKAVLMAAIRQEVEPRRGPTIVPQVPYEDVSAALAFLERVVRVPRDPDRAARERGRRDRPCDARVRRRRDRDRPAGRTTARSARRVAASRASTSACTSTTSMRTISARSPRVRGSPTGCATTSGATRAIAPTRRSTSRATAGASTSGCARCRSREEEHRAPLRILVLRSVHDRDRLVGPLSRDAGDRHAAVHGAAGRVRDRDPQRRSAVRAALGPVGTEEDAAAGLDAQGGQLFPPPAVEQLRGLPLLPPHDGDRPQHDLGGRRGAPLRLVSRGGWREVPGSRPSSATRSSRRRRGRR